MKKGLIFVDMIVYSLVIIIVGVPAMLLIKSVYGFNIAEHVDLLSTFSIILVAVVGLATFIQNRVNRVEDKKPLVVAYLVQHHRHPHLLNICIESIGNSPAYDVKYRFDFGKNVKLGKEFASRHKYSLGTQEETKNRSAIGVFPCGCKYQAGFGSSFDLLGEKEYLPAFEVVFEYEDKDGEPYQTRSLIDVKQFEGFTWFGQPSEHEIAEGIKKISETLRKISTYSRLRVEIITENERKKQDEDFYNDRAKEKEKEKE